MVFFLAGPADVPSHYECIVDNYALQKKVKDQAYQMMASLEGWCSKTKAMVLMDIIFNHQPEVIVEVGVYGGKSLIPMAHAAKALGKGTVYGIDPWKSADSVIGFQDANYEWWAKLDHEKIFSGFVNKVNEFKLNNSIRIIRATSKEAKPIENIGLIHIDGNHSEDSALFDVKKWVPLVKKGGFIAFDDVDWRSTNKAVEWLNEHCIRVTTFQEDNVWGLWIKK